jgi:A1 cistron-splicing factor AAR2
VICLFVITNILKIIINMEEYDSQEPQSQQEGILVITDLPLSPIEFGTDCIVYETGPNFKGIGLIPKGLHFLYYSVGMGSRQGFFIDSNNDVQVKCWNSQYEEISFDTALSAESLSTLAEAMKRGELNQSIGSYPYQQYNIWKNLSSFVNRRVLVRANADINTPLYPGDSQDINLAAESSPLHSSIHPPNEYQVSTYFPGHARIARFCEIRAYETKLREQINAETANPDRIKKLTSINMDKSDLVELVKHEYFDDIADDLLGEVQLAFILFINLYSYPALETWKSYVNIICSSERFLLANPLFTIGFIRVLYEQLNFAPNDFFEDEISKANFLGPSLTALFSALSSIAADSIIYEHKKRFLTYLNKKFNFHEDIFDRTDVSVSVQSDEHEHVIHDLETCREYQEAGIWDDSKPIIVDETSSQPDLPRAASDTLTKDEAVDHQTRNSDLAEVDLLHQKYSWRYPLLFESMQGSPFKEDCFMAAARIIDDYGFLLNEGNTKTLNLPPAEQTAINNLLIEAKMFIEYEIQLL